MRRLLMREAQALPRARLPSGSRAAPSLPPVVVKESGVYPLGPDGQQKMFDGLLFFQEGPQEIAINSVSVAEKLRGQNYGKAMYEALAEHAKARGKRLVSDSTVSEDARRMWDYLASRGHSVVRNELVEPRHKPYPTSLGPKRGGPAFVLEPSPEYRFGVPVDPATVFREAGYDPGAGTLQEWAAKNNIGPLAAAAGAGGAGAYAFDWLYD